ncbi:MULTISPECIES: hypothetical protein [Bacillaceae]|uniref:Uncharacterized protein n=1 Tax=Evansella alkalicola TaxID=745819 RepID=A0ABS6JN23_9BACI|nr:MULTISPECIES: hypothetical protein [Bacillaceae]MBU9719957.1 hypothetical protein [Bacillus alkalicola]
MSEFLDKLGMFSKHLGEGVSKLFKHGEKRNIRIWELASFIFDHPDTRKTTQELLGLVFNEYRLTIGPISLKLETKGENDEHILELLAMEQGEELFSFKSYEEDQTVKDKYALPEYVYVHLVEG